MVNLICGARIGPANSQLLLCKVLYNLEKKVGTFLGHFLATLIPIRTKTLKHQRRGVAHRTDTASPKI